MPPVVVGAVMSLRVYTGVAGDADCKQQERVGVMNANAARTIANDKLVAYQPVIEKACLQAKPGLEPTLDPLGAAQLRDLLVLATQHITAQNDLLVLDENPLRARRIADIDIGFLQKNLELTNTWIGNGMLGLDGGTKLVSKSPFFWQGEILNVDRWEASVELNWYGWCLCMNEELTNAICAALAANAGAMTILAMLELAGFVTAPAIIPTAIVAAVMLVGGMVLLANSRGNGVCICQLWFPPGHVSVFPRP